MNVNVNYLRTVANEPFYVPMVAVDDLFRSGQWIQVERRESLWHRKQVSWPLTTATIRSTRIRGLFQPLVSFGDTSDSISKSFVCTSSLQNISVQPVPGLSRLSAPMLKQNTSVESIASPDRTKERARSRISEGMVYSCVLTSEGVVSEYRSTECQTAKGGRQ